MQAVKKVDLSAADKDDGKLIAAPAIFLFVVNHSHECVAVFSSLLVLSNNFLRISQRKIEIHTGLLLTTGPQKLSKIEIKKMKPAELKSALKDRGLSIQGQKGDLMERLIEHECS